MIRRREFIALLGGAAAWPVAASAQQPAMPVVGILAVISAEANALRMRAFREALSAAGYVDGQNVQIKYRWAEPHRLPELASQLAQDQVVVLVAAGGTASALAAKAATATIPIVFATAADPVQIGLVASLNRPGGNATGVTSINLELGPKRLELMRELLPSVSTMALLVNPTTPAIAEPSTRISQAAAHALGLELHVLQARSEHDFDPTFAKLVELRARALIIAPDQLFTAHSKRLAELTLQHSSSAPPQMAIRCIMSLQLTQSVRRSSTTSSSISSAISRRLRASSASRTLSQSIYRCRSKQSRSSSPMPRPTRGS